MGNADVPKPEVHPDFASPADVILVSDDGTIFRVASSWQLARASGWFRKLVSVAYADTKQKAVRDRVPITLPQDTLTLEILLKICCGRAPGLSRLQHLSELELCLSAAGLYEMPCATEVLLLLLHAPRMQVDALYLYGVAELYGAQDIAASAIERVIREERTFEHIPSALDARALGRVVARRQARITKFCSLLVQKDAAAPFYLHNSPCCTHPVMPPKTPHRRAHPASWTSLVLAMQTAFIKRPSVEALELDQEVHALLVSLEYAVCGHEGCNKLQYKWRDIRLLLQQAMDEEGTAKGDD